MHAAHGEVFVQLGVQAREIRRAPGVHLRYVVDWPVLGKRFRKIEGCVGAARRVPIPGRDFVTTAKALQRGDIYDPWEVIIAWSGTPFNPREHGSPLANRSSRHLP